MMFSNASVFAVPNEMRIEMIPCSDDSTLNSVLKKQVSNDNVFERFSTHFIAIKGPRF